MENPKPPNDVIAAVATAPGRGGIGIVRLSGPDLGSHLLRLLGKVLAPRKAVRVSFRDRAGSRIDEGLAIYFPAPHSYTGEDVIELQGHGGPVVMQLLLQRCLDLGARPAQPGEFTRRAFLNDKLDLAQAEAVADLIEATTAAAARSAARSLSGEFSLAIHRLVDRLVEMRLLVEATLDFPEEEIDFLSHVDVPGRLLQLQQDVSVIRRKARQGSLLRSGLHIVLAGRPNVGKSSLLNRLAGEERAIVTAVAGTTRDALRETIQIRGIPLHIIDTAGLRETDDEVERFGISRTWREIERADAVIFMLDACSGMTEEDAAIVARLPPAVRRIDVCNKSDLMHLPGQRSESEGRSFIWLSAKTGMGVDQLEQELLRIAGYEAGQEDAFMSRERHLRALAIAANHLETAQQEQGRIEFFAEELRLAQEALTAITGEFSSDDLLGEIFSRFCIGK